ncbi:MAG: ATP-binding protein [Deltaproteobacteria bacterium]|nr:ATP-binding protein [Deltaproteobacteria bacterium]
MTSKRFRRLLGPPNGSFFLLGPRGTGKSTWLRTTFPTARRFDLLDEALYQAYLRDVGRFADALRTCAVGSTVVVDEIQRLPALLNEVHRFIEDRELRFALCGSSARKLKTAGTNLLAGRAAMRSMHSLLPEELGEAFDLDAALQFGTLPIVWSSNDRRETLSAYARLYLREEIQAEAVVRNLPGFARFLPVAALLHAQVVNVSSLSRDAEVSRSTVGGYLEVLEDTLLTFKLPAFEARLRVRERRHPKLYWSDPGVPRAMKGQLGPPTAEERGHLFDGWIASLLRAYRDYQSLFDDWFYWAPGRDSSLEVDFLLKKDQQLVAIEVKSSNRIEDRDLRGLRAVAELPGVRRRLVVSSGARAGITADGIELVPLEDFLALVQSSTLFPSA